MFIWTYRTILVFGETSPWYGKSLPTKEFSGKVTFWDYHKNEFIYGRLVFKSSPLLWSSRRGFCLSKQITSGFLEHAHFGKVCISLHLVTLPKMAPQAKPLCSRDSYRFWVEPRSYMNSYLYKKTPNIVPWPECQPKHLFLQGDG